MRFKYINLIGVAACSALCLGTVMAQVIPVKVKFEVDGKEPKQKFRILVYADGTPVEPAISEAGEFYAPALDVEKVDVRLISDGHDLLYEGVYLKKLRGRLVFGVKENLLGEGSSCEPGKKLVASYYLEFHPEDAEGTAMSVSVCR